MPKDNENVPFFSDEPLTASEPQGFAPDQMVRCEQCLRANPPTRLGCLYCAAPLPVSEKTAELLKPSLKPVQNWALGYNNIFLPQATEIPVEALSEAAGLLKLSSNDLRRLLSSLTPMPLARTDSLDEARLIDRRLKDLGFEMAIVSDADLGLRESPPIRLRSVSIDENGLTPKLIVETDESQIRWSQLVLLVTARLSRKRIELQERKGGRGDNEITDESQFFADELVLDLYSEGPDAKFRILANGFDFSGLRGKRLLVAENFALLLDLIRDQSPRAEYDDAYNSSRQALEIVWPCGQQTESSGWRRQRAGKYTVGAVTESSNEDQFTRYSRLRYFLKARVRS
ncbi:MAG: hypothetical protein ND866_29120 [Pyrinomonadaceae bacterium]|nr:hypothetical protein [Pyrinomonadaceae bacterium]